jgi:RHS repeat-associated protein
MYVRTRWIRAVAVLCSVVMLANSVPTARAAEPLGGLNGSTLAREPQLTPEQIGDGSVDGLQYGDPTEGLAIIEPPEAGNGGGAQLSYPMVIPKGRGIAPQLSLEYDSGGGNGWVGQGWDLSVGEISVDTRWGAPFFNPDFESETYAIDGDMLIPNALGATWEPREAGDRQDYTRQVETEYQQIIRHEAPDEDGDGGTDDYFWEVHDKGGNVFWYGGLPDQGGPDGYAYLPDSPADPSVVPTIDRSAIVTDENGNGVRWLLSAQRDVGVNQISYHYTTVHYQYGDDGWTTLEPGATCTPTNDVLCAKHTYLGSINYTEAATIAPAPDGDAEYEVQFKLESAVYPARPVRADPTVDGMGGFVDLVTDRLVRVDVYHGDYTVLTEVDGDGNVVPDLDDEGNEQRTARDYDPAAGGTLAMRYDLDYTIGAFGKSLLASVTQVGSDETTSATHAFDYVNRVGTNATGYDGFEGTAADWNTGDDLPDRAMLFEDTAIGALGSSESNSGEGHAYIGFNPIVPNKVGSFGGSLQIGGGATEAVAEWLDINGDGLSDKVYRDSDGVDGDTNDVNRNGPIRYRLNTSGPGGGTTFGDEKTVTGITRLSTEGNFGIEGAFEAFPGVTIAFGLGAEVTWGDAYFSDANADGLPDYVSGGKVWFNHLDALGVPTFVESNSSLTPVPIDDTAAASAVLPDEVAEIQEQLAASNPLVDTVRRWTAPVAGTVEILAPVELRSGGGLPSDGVRVAIEQDGTELASGNLAVAGAEAFGTPITDVIVDAGDDIYFRLGSVNEGINDDVDWSPTVTYTAITGVDPGDLPNLATDVNGLSQTEFVAADDFTLSGRPDTMVFMPFEGSVNFSATIHKLATTDDVTVVLTHTHKVAGVVTETDYILGTLLAADTTPVGTGMPVSQNVTVAAPVQPTEDDPDLDPFQDSLSVKIVTDTPIDLHAISWDPSIHYNSGVRDGEPLDDPETIAFKMTPEIEQYPHRSPTTVSLPFATGTATSSRDARVTFNTFGPSSPAGTAIVTVKTRDGVVARDTVDVPGSIFGLQVSADADLNVVLEADTDYWFDVTIRDAALSDKVQSLASFTLTDGTPANNIDPPATLNWTGRQGIFPLAYRGWAVAGYNGAPTDDEPNRDTDPIIETDFEIDIDDENQPTQPADPGFGNVGDSDPSQDKSYAYLPAVQRVTFDGAPTPVVDPTPVWVGSRANMAATASVMRSSRLGLDSVDIGGGSSAGGGRAVTRISVTAPSAKLAFGVGPLGASFGVSPSFGLVDFTDMNGDGYPDVVTPNNVTYTTQRGAYLAAGQNPGELAVTNQDLTLAVGVGIESGLVDITANSKGKTNATQGGSANKGGDANDSGGGIGVGVSFDVSWTSPNASGGDAPLIGDAANPSESYEEHADDTGEVEGLPGATAPIQLGLADVNGDGLADRVFTNPNGVFARYNLGYSFSAPVMLSTGGFESQESYAGGLSLGFSTPWADFSGGASLNWNIDLSRYAWVDVNGDGILDQVHKIDNTSKPTVRFGTGSGMLPAVEYGDMASSNIAGIDAGQQSSLDRSSGVGGQFDFTVAIGPLCLVACYLIINPGASYQNSISSTEIDLQDVNGDGYADSLQTLDDHSLLVRENKQADTNLLSSVHNPLGGTISMTYERDGNTVESPKSSWNMISVEVDDGRPGDGIDVTRTEYEYEGLLADRLHRASLGYSTMTETEIDTDPASPTVGDGLRQTVHTYMNGNIFESGLETSTTVNDLSNGGYIKGVKQTWQLVDVRGGADLDALTAVASLGYSIAPRVLQVITEVGTGAPGGVGQSSTTNLTYSDLGDVIRQEDLGEDDDPNDDVVADMLYSRCPLSSTIGCADDQPHDRPSPLWDADLCPTWVSLPVDITISDGNGQIYRHRNGEGAICDNASVTHLEEDIGDGTAAETELTYDAWGSYDRIVYPLGENGMRYAVLYEWDPDGHATIAKVTEFDLDPETIVECDDGDPETPDPGPGPDLGTAVDHFLGGGGLCPADDPRPDVDIYTEGVTSSATFDPQANKVASRTDANGNVTTYTYDPLARLASIITPLSDPAPLVTFEYSVGDDPHVVAEHYDVFNPGDTIDTAAFSDGIGRVVQTQRDATLFRGASVPAVDGVIVSGATFFDTLGRAVRQYNPTEGTTTLGTFDPNSPLADTKFTQTVYDLWDLPGTITEPGDRVTEIVYDYGEVNPGDGITVYETTETAPNGRQTVSYTDIRDVVRAIDDIPDGLPVGDTGKRTTYASDGMGQLLTVTDPNDNITTHTYDLMGRRLSTDTPDGGLVEFAYDADGQQVSKTTPNLRAEVPAQEISYAYDLHRLVGIDYPGTKDDVTYDYGAMGAPDNGAGQVVRTEDGARIATNVYDAAGNITEQTSEMKLHDWYNNPGGDKTMFQWTMGWTYDGLGRKATVTFPDPDEDPWTHSKVLTYGYDAGGLVNNITGEELGYITVQNGVDPITGVPIFVRQEQTWNYKYLQDRQYDEFLRTRLDRVGNGATTEYSFDPNTLWLTRQQTISPRPKATTAPYKEIQDLNYTYDDVGNPETYANNIPAPQSNLFSGPTTQTYTYDPYERIVAGTGTWQEAAKKTRTYTLGLTYDEQSNVVSKEQVDKLTDGKKTTLQYPGTYTFERNYPGATPHQATGTVTTNKNGVVTDIYEYDLNGNLTGILEPDGDVIRDIDWDANDRMTRITDGPVVTDYAYDDSGQRAIERGASGETAFVNPWLTVVQNKMFQNIWASDDRIGVQRDDGGIFETKQYFLHKDLQGSTNIVTDQVGDTFQHHEYFPTGEVWIDEKSTIFRTQYQYAGGYADDWRHTINFGARWYDQNREMFYSPDPVLTDDPSALVRTPSLQAAYAYGGNNPMTNVDPGGWEFTAAQRKAFIKANMADARRIVGADPALQATIAANLRTRLPKALVKLGLDIQSAELHQKRFEMIDDVAKPFVEINISTGEVKLSPGLFKQFTVREGKTTQASTAPQDATNGTGGPTVNAGAGNNQQDASVAAKKPSPPTPTAKPKPRSKPVSSIPQKQSSGGNSAAGNM